MAMFFFQTSTVLVRKARRCARFAAPSSSSGLRTLNQESQCSPSLHLFSYAHHYSSSICQCSSIYQCLCSPLPFIYFSIYPSINPSFYLSLSIYFSILSIYQSILLPIYLSIYLSCLCKLKGSSLKEVVLRLKSLRKRAVIGLSSDFFLIFQIGAIQFGMHEMNAIRVQKKCYLFWVSEKFVQNN